MSDFSSIINELARIAEKGSPAPTGANASAGANAPTGAAARAVQIRSQASLLAPAGRTKVNPKVKDKGGQVSAPPRAKVEAKAAFQLDPKLEHDANRQAAIAFIMRNRVRADLAGDAFAMLLGRGIVAESMALGTRLFTEAWRPDVDHLADVARFLMASLAEKAAELEVGATRRRPFDPALRAVIQITLSRVAAILRGGVKPTGAGGIGEHISGGLMVLWKVIYYLMFAFAVVSTVHVGTSAVYEAATDSPLSRTSEMGAGAVTSVYYGVRSAFDRTTANSTEVVLGGSWRQASGEVLLSYMREVSGLPDLSPIILDSLLDPPPSPISLDESKLIAAAGAAVGPAPEGAEEVHGWWATATGVAYSTTAMVASGAGAVGSGVVATYQSGTLMVANVAVTASGRNVVIMDAEEAFEKTRAEMQNEEFKRWASAVFDRGVPSLAYTTSRLAGGEFQRRLYGGRLEYNAKASMLSTIVAHIKPFFQDLLRFPFADWSPPFVGATTRTGNVYESDFAFVAAAILTLLYGKGVAWRSIVQPFVAKYVVGGVFAVERGARDATGLKAEGTVSGPLARLFQLRLGELQIERTFVRDPDGTRREVPRQQLLEEAERLEREVREGVLTVARTPQGTALPVQKYDNPVVFD